MGNRWCSEKTPKTCLFWPQKDGKRRDHGADEQNVQVFENQSVKGCNTPDRLAKTYKLYLLRNRRWLSNNGFLGGIWAPLPFGAEGLASLSQRFPIGNRPLYTPVKFGIRIFKSRSSSSLTTLKSSSKFSAP